MVDQSNYEFYTFDAKYVDPSAAKLVVPAELDSDIQQKVMKLSIDAYQALRCEDYARVDLFLSEQGQVFVNEINTIPGFTNSSMFPKMWENMGISYTDLITRILEMAVNRHTKQNELSREFASKLD